MEKRFFNAFVKQDGNPELIELREENQRLRTYIDRVNRLEDFQICPDCGDDYPIMMTGFPPNNHLVCVDCIKIKTPTCCMCDRLYEGHMKLYVLTSILIEGEYEYTSLCLQCGESFLNDIYISCGNNCVTCGGWCEREHIEESLRQGAACKVCNTFQCSKCLRDSDVIMEYRNFTCSDCM